MRQQRGKSLGLYGILIQGPRKGRYVEEYRGGSRVKGISKLAAWIRV